jgi:cbb3-type cytochrome oxidase subunit 3
MKSEVLANSDLSYLSILALFLFLGLFVSLVIWSVRKSNKGGFKEVETLPLDEGVKL